MRDEDERVLPRAGEAWPVDLGHLNVMSRLTVSVWGCSGLLCCPVLNEIFVHHPCLGAKGIQSGGLENQPNE